MEQIFSLYSPQISDNQVSEQLAEVLKHAPKYKTEAVYKQIFGFLDLTTLSETDTKAKARRFAENVNNFKAKFPQMPHNVAAICVYPSLVEEVRKNLNVKIGLASVVGGFPSSQTLIEIKTAETRLAFEKGASEADTVISVGTFLSGDYQTVYDEVKFIKEACGDGHLKVILETGALKTAENIKKASILAIEAGGDFIKTSTGKTQPAATLEAMFVMAQTVKEYHNRTGKYIGIKPAGGIADADSAVNYYTIMKEVLGDAWLTPELFRIGASSLANNLLSEITKTEVSYF